MAKLQIMKVVSNSELPKYSRDGDAALDLVATSKTYTPEYIEYGTGLAFKIPKDHVGLLFPRSSVSNYGLDLCNSVGVIDENYTGEVKLRFRRLDFGKMYEIGDRVGQLLVIEKPRLELEEVESLEYTNRGDSGFGSSGR